jgi:hypothetical protein
MCYGDIDHGKDGYYRAELERQEQEEQRRRQEDDEDDHQWNQNQGCPMLVWLLIGLI